MNAAPSYASATIEVARHGVRGLFRSKTILGAGLVGGFAIALAIILAASDAGGTQKFESFTLALMATVESPLIGLLLGAWAMGAEREGGTLVFLYARPVRRSAILLGRIVAANVAAVSTMVIVALACDIAMGGGLPSLPGVIVALTLETAAFTCLFALLGTLMPRALYVGLAYAVLIEGVLGGVVSLQGGVTLGQHARNLLVRWSATDPIPSFRLTQDDTTSMLVLSGAILAFTALAMLWVETRETSGRDRVKGE